MDKYHETTPKTELKSAVLGRESSKKKAGKPVPRDQFMEIVKLMAKHHIHDHTENGLTFESVEVLVSGMQQAWQIINVLNMAEMDNGDAYPKALEWLEKWGDLNPRISQPNT